jgi:calpain-7
MALTATRWFPPVPVVRVSSDFNSEATELELSDAQREIFAGWRRPRENLDQSSDGQNREPDDDHSLMASVDSIDLVQDITTDCSVVASLCAGTARASKGHGKVCLNIPFLYKPFR